MFDLEMIRTVHERFPGRVAAARQATGKALTLAEKILYTHLWDGEAQSAFTRGADYVDFAPDRVAKHTDGSEDTIVCNHTYNAQQFDWFRAGSALNLINQQNS